MRVITLKVKCLNLWEVFSTVILYISHFQLTKLSHLVSKRPTAAG